MYAIKLSFKNLLILAFIVCIFSILFNPVAVYARTAEEIATEKDSKQKELDTLNAELKKAQQSLNLNLSQKSASLSEIEKIKAELAQIEEEFKINTLKKQQLEQEIGIKALEKEQKEQEQDVQIAGSYISWKTQDESYLILGGEDILKNAIYYSYVTETSKDSILGLTSELDLLNKSNEEYQKQITLLEGENVTLKDKKIALEKQISQINKNITSARGAVGNIKQKIELVSAEHQALLDLEKQLLGFGDTIGTLDITSGQVYFFGTGRDAAQGHGVGLSQYGAKGYAQAGWTAQNILTFYYTGTTVKAITGESINVAGYGSMDINTYVAGLGEVPDKACGNAEQIVQNPLKYVIDNPSNGWDCWPEEAIKAQVIAARSYGVTSTQPICTDARCQVYKGGNAKQWAADETANQFVIRESGKILRAYYSSDNSQGFGTANIETVWPAQPSGGGEPDPHFRHVNDTQHALKTEWTNWSWRTNGYNMQQINEMVLHAASNPANFHSIKTVNTVGTITGLSFTKDPSQRVKLVTITGTKGSINMSGSYFKAIWNIWISAKKPSGQYDYIYSLTWNYQAQQ